MTSQPYMEWIGQLSEGSKVTVTGTDGTVWEVTVGKRRPAQTSLAQRQKTAAERGWPANLTCDCGRAIAYAQLCDGKPHPMEGER